jgi:hypothetical protein
LQDFAALHKCQIAVQFGLEEQLMAGAVGPVQVVADSKNVGTGDVNKIRLLYLHSTTSAFSKRNQKMKRRKANPSSSTSSAS